MPDTDFRVRVASKKVKNYHAWHWLQGLCSQQEGQKLSCIRVFVLGNFCTKKKGWNTQPCSWIVGLCSQSGSTTLIDAVQSPDSQFAIHQVALKTCVVNVKPFATWALKLHCPITPAMPTGNPLSACDSIKAWLAGKRTNAPVLPVTKLILK